MRLLDDRTCVLVNPGSSYEYPGWGRRGIFLNLCLCFCAICLFESWNTRDIADFPLNLREQTDSTTGLRALIPPTAFYLSSAMPADRAIPARWPAKARLPIAPGVQRTPLRHRSKSAKDPQQQHLQEQANSRTPAEADAALVKRRARQAEIAAAVQASIAEVLKMAAANAERFPEHTEAWFYESIMQSTKVSKTRMLSLWNIFLSKRLKEHNNGTLAVQ